MKKTTRNLLIFSLAACFLALMVKMTVGALPNQMKAARMTDSTLASTIDTHVGDIETAITDILGIPIDTNITRAGFAWSASGLERIKFMALADPGSPVSGDMWLSSTTANTLKYYDGTATRSVVDLSLTQTLTNKTLTSPTITTPTLTVNDNGFTVQDDGDTTKKFVFQASGITTATTRTFTAPDLSGTWVLTAGAQTLTDKTLTAPVINGTVTTTGLTLPAITLGGTVSGGGNQINNVIIGTSTPLAGSFTTVVGSTSVSTPSIITASGALGITPAAGSGLNINLSTTGDLAVNTNQLYVDTSESRVGIGTASPRAILEIFDGFFIIAKPAVGGDKNWRILTSDAVAGDLALQQSATSGGVDFATKVTFGATGNVGIGTTTFGAGAVNVITLGNGTAPGALASTASIVALAGEMWAYNAGGTGTQLSGWGTGVSTFLVTPSSANLAAAVTGETGSGALVFATSPSFTTPSLGAATATTIDASTSFGVVGTATRIRTSLATPGTLVNGDWWTECSGTTPNRVCSINVQDGSATRILASIVY